MNMEVLLSIAVLGLVFYGVNGSILKWIAGACLLLIIGIDVTNMGGNLLMENG